MMGKLCFYLSDHGFGHMARTIPIIKQTLKLSADAELVVVCQRKHLEFARGNLLTEELSRIEFREDHTDVGLILKDGTLEPDVPRLENACRGFLNRLPEKAREEARWLREYNICAVYCDMPIWAISAAQMAGVPLLYSGNFTWAEIYREFLPEDIWMAYAEEYKKIRHGLYYALHNKEMMEFVSGGSETSLSVRPFDADKVADMRKTMGAPMVFVALGMSAQFNGNIDVSGLPYRFCTTGGIHLEGPNVVTLPREIMDTHNYIMAADYVITKAGWGTVAEALLARKPMALFERDCVLEDRWTIGQLEEKGLAVKINVSDLHDLQAVIEKLEAIRGMGDYSCFYDASSEIAMSLLRLANEKRGRL